MTSASTGSLVDNGPQGSVGGVEPMDDPPAATGIEPRRVLVVDDEPQVARLVVRYLERSGYFKASYLTSPEAALKQLENDPVDLVISDLTMPEMTGLEFIRALRRFDEDTPVILLTGTPSLETAQRAVELGAFRYLTKPCGADDLVSAARHAAFSHRIARLKRQAFNVTNAAGGTPSDHIGLEYALDAAIASLWMAYQPIVHAASGAVFGYEALMRTDEPRLPHPGAVLDAAERLGREKDIERAVRDKAPLAMAQAPEGALLFINLLPGSLQDDRLGTEVELLTSMSRRVVLEITERASLRRIPEVERKIARLRELGFRIAVDDLGAGYAGLSSFAALQPDIVKLDMSLIRDIDSSKLKSKLVGSMVNACHELGVTVVAEGIETPAERDTCVALGCDLLQGYLLARPGRPFPVVNW